MKEIHLGRGQVAIVDDEDYPVVSQMAWHAKWNRGARRWEAEHSTGFTISVRKRGCRCIGLAQFLIGRAPEGQCIDHRNRNQLDNRRENLRFASRTQSNQNRRRAKTSRSPYKGVKQISVNKWQARISVNRKRMSLGSTFPTALDAALAYNDAALQHFGEFACLNEIELKEAA